MLASHRHRSSERLGLGHRVRAAASKHSRMARPGSTRGHDDLQSWTRIPLTAAQSLEFTRGFWRERPCGDIRRSRSFLVDLGTEMPVGAQSAGRDRHHPAMRTCADVGASCSSGPRAAAAPARGLVAPHVHPVAASARARRARGPRATGSRLGKHVRRAADRAAARQLRVAAYRHLLSQLQAAQPPDLWRATADMLHLIDNPLSRDGFFPPEAQRYAACTRRAGSTAVAAPTERLGRRMAKWHRQRSGLAAEEGQAVPRRPDLRIRMLGGLDTTRGTRRAVGSAARNSSRRRRQTSETTTPGGRSITLRRAVCDRG